MNKLDPDMFVVKEDKGLRLIVPSHTAGMANAPWAKDTLQYRSRVETEYGRTVSQGFKKFFNLGMGPVDLQVTFDDVVNAIVKGDAVATLKVDGSLLVRSEYHGKVMCRTRGSFGWEHLDNAFEMLIFEEEYPELFKTGKYPTLSLLFEWVSPMNVIVLKYPEPKLTLIGGVDHADLTYLRMDQLEPIAKTLGVPLVQYFPLTPEGWRRLNVELEGRQDIEGYVIRLHREQDLVKVKCLPYLTKHALKDSLNSEKLADMYFQQGKPSFAEFCTQFKATFDEETCMWALGAISALYDGVKPFDKIIAHMREKAKERADWTRKDAALTGLAEYGQTKRFGAYMKIWEGKEPDTEVLKSILLQNTKQVELGMFAKPEAQ